MSTPPFYGGTCSPVACPSTSVGIFLYSGCACPAGYSGALGAIVGPPYYINNCIPVPCPDGSTGTSVVAGCTCIGTNPAGSVVATSVAPYYISTCTGEPWFYFLNLFGKKL